MAPFSTDPNVWFLTDRENDASNLFVFTSNNKVEALVDGAQYMHKLHALIGVTASDDYIFFAGWQMDAALRMIYGDPNSKVEDVFVSADRKGTDIRVMLSGHPRDNNNNLIRDTFILSSGIECILDRRSPPAGSFHQKLASILHDGILNCFCGGIDLAINRWDTQSHDNLTDRQFDTQKGGWHDIQCSVLGPACQDLDLTFRERWNDRTPPDSLTSAPAQITVPVPPQPNVGTHHVQVLRTYACDNSFHSYPFAPQGEYSARLAYLNAISLAQDYIYIEDQFFVSYEIANAILAQLNTVPNLRVIILVPEEPDEKISIRQQFNFHQHELLTRLGAAAPDRFAVYHLRNVTLALFDSQVFVHAKTMIIDDVWAQIGSMNCNRRSMNHDAEVGVAVVDDTIVDGVCKFARDLRINLWTEHLSGASAFDSDRLVDPIEGFDEWAANAGTGNAKAVPHTAGLPRNTSLLLWNIVDPPQVCPDDPSTS